MDYLPIFLRLQGRYAVVVGGGAVAARKAELLLKCGAEVALVAPTLLRPAQELLAGYADAALQASTAQASTAQASTAQASTTAQASMATQPSMATHNSAVAQAAGGPQLRHVPQEFDPVHLSGAAVVIAATDSRSVNAAVADAARVRGIPVNVADDPELSDFILPAIVDRSPVIVAIGSQGATPVLSRRVREQIEALLPARLGELARFAASRRRAVQQALDLSLRRPFWERFFSSLAGDAVLGGDESAAGAAFERTLEEFRRREGTPVGEVYLIGAGPGDPDLLTLKALQLLQQADVLLYDRLVSPAVLERARREAERIFVGKQAGEAALSQQHINALLVSHARRGLKVARLKGGDPFIFGRGGEEATVLAQHGIPFTVVPGITAALGAAAAAHIPLTQREVSQSVTFAPGHVAAADTLDWPALARSGHTVVFYMAMAQLDGLIQRLVEAGAPPARPVALVAQATLPAQRVVRGTLESIAATARAEKLAAPALLIVGDVTRALQQQALETFGQSLRGVA